MQLRATTDNAIRILQHMHKHQKPQSGVYIAKAVGISYVLFTRTVKRLKQEGLLVTSRGRNGGFSLGGPGAEISLYDVYACMEGDLHISDHLKDERGSQTSDYFQTVQGNIIESMSAKSIADLA